MQLQQESHSIFAAKSLAAFTVTVSATATNRRLATSKCCPMVPTFVNNLIRLEYLTAEDRVMDAAFPDDKDLDLNDSNVASRHRRLRGTHTYFTQYVTFACSPTTQQQV